jgi:hypothetical protein
MTNGDFLDEVDRRPFVLGNIYMKAQLAHFRDRRSKHLRFRQLICPLGGKLL